MIAVRKFIPCFCRDWISPLLQGSHHGDLMVLKGDTEARMNPERRLPSHHGSRSSLHART
jgi:hypothetical protein